MVRKDGAYVKQQRLKLIAARVAKDSEKGPISLKKLLAWIQLNIGLTPQTALQYVQLNAEVFGWRLDLDSDILEVPTE